VGGVRREPRAGTEVEGEVKNKTEFGLFIGLEGDVDGMVHLSDLDWNRPGEQVIEEYNKGDMVKAVVLDVDVDKERISLGIKQLGKRSDRRSGRSGELRKGAVVTCEGDRGHRRWPRSEDRRSRPDLLHPPLRPVPRPRRAASRALLGRREGRRARHPVRQEDRAFGLSIKALEIAEEKEASHSSARPTPAHRSATFSAPR
jgi:small subunit ribosomal protein S1